MDLDVTITGIFITLFGAFMLRVIAPWIAEKRRIDMQAGRLEWDEETRASGELALRLIGWVFLVVGVIGTLASLF